MLQYKIKKYFLLPPDAAVALLSPKLTNEI